MTIVTIQYGQSIWDMAIQCYGSVASVFDFIEDNAFDDGLDTLLTPGQKVKIISAPSDQGMLTYIQQNNLIIVGGAYALNQRVLENADTRLLESGDYRILEN